ncbi:SusC/RagA family TonB-linked outer membrane protein [Chitinophaga sp. 212800010-3]|uniref:SusC/RagA family TonB-linked outer membrane protein n=1 Tax=unclassified Chitinophaga TaxID=2619133 RepID=UPI002DE368DC|nr:SusC/RagA family TonB-linked outer membrane protein [Chitinophaga sp. 212800010-3]
MKLLSLALIGLTLQLSARDPIEKLPPEVYRQNIKTGPIHGVVRNAKGEAVSGASVKVRGSAKGAITATSGAFELDVQAGTALTVSAIGYKSREVPAADNMIIVLTEEVKELEGVVVTGFQSIDRNKFAGSAVTLKAENVKIAGVTDVSRMLEGRAAGVSVQNVSGSFGAAPKLRIRGATSISGENKPLWVVDGVVLEDIVNVSNEQLTSGNIQTLLGSAVAGLNADDIETIDILKDAAATALYGARAMNGVVVITTKKGKSGKPIVSYTGNFGVQLKPSYRNYDIMNSADQMSVYAELERKELLQYSQLINQATSGIYGKLGRLLQTPDADGKFAVLNTREGRQEWLMRYANANTDWFDVLFRNSLTQEHSISISSGSDKSQLYLSTSFYNDQGWTIADKVKRYTVNIRANYTPNSKLSYGVLVNGNVRQQRAPGTEDRQTDDKTGMYKRDFDINPFFYALNTSRALTAYDQKGQLEYFTRNYAPFNILDETRNNYTDVSVMDLKLQGNLGYRFNSHFNYEFIGAIRYAKTTSEHNVNENSNEANAYRANGTAIINGNNPFLYKNPDLPNDPAVVVLPYGGFYKRSDVELKNYTFRNQFNYNQVFNDERHQVTALVGQEVKYADRQTAANTGVGYQYNTGGTPFIDYLFIKKMTENNNAYYGMSREYDRFTAFYASGSYTYQKKYTLNATGRVDGSNRLGSSSKARWLPTWTVAGNWNVAEESFLKDANAVSHMYLKASYGLNASTGSATNTTPILRSFITNRPYLVDQQTAILLQALENADLTWEKKYELDLGTDMGFFNERLGFTFDYYRRRSFDLIGLIKTSGVGGQVNQFANYANMKSNGVDVMLTGKLIAHKNMDLTSTLVFSYNNTLITNARNNPILTDLIGEGGGSLQGYPVRGLFSLQNAGLNPANGVAQFINDTGTVSSAVYLKSHNVQYLRYEGPSDPTITGGWSNSFRYKNFTLMALVTYQAGNKIRLTPVYSTDYSDFNSLPNEFKGRWSLPGDEKKTNIPSIADIYTQTNLTNNTAFPYSNYNFSHDRVADGSFVRLKSVALTYQLPGAMATRFGLKGASLTATGNNLWLIYSAERLHGQDPEFYNTGGVALPVNKQVTFSLRVSL